VLTFDLKKEGEFNDFVHFLCPNAQDDACGGIFGIKFGVESVSIPLERLYTLESIKELAVRFDMIAIDYGNSSGDSSVTYLNLRVLEAVFHDEAGQVKVGN